MPARRRGWLRVSVDRLEHCLEAVLIEDLHQGVSEQLILNILFCFLLFTLSRFSKNSLILGDAVFIKSREWDRLGPGAGEGCTWWG